MQLLPVNDLLVVLTQGLPAISCHLKALSCILRRHGDQWFLSHLLELRDQKLDLVVLNLIMSIVCSIWPIWTWMRYATGLEITMEEF
jgi:hypothetical protein